MTSEQDLIRVHLVGVPVGLWHRGRVWFDGLLREFDILAADHGETTPRELLEFVAETRERFSGFTDEPNTALEEAHRRGVESTDVDLYLPPVAAPVARDLWAHLARALEYCHSGDLLTLTPDRELTRYLEWYLHEIARQLEGEAPRPFGAQSPPR